MGSHEVVVGLVYLSSEVGKEVAELCTVETREGPKQALSS